MATGYSQTGPTRLSERRRRTVEEALDHAQAIVAAQGVGAVTVSELARRMGMRGPSLYKYFPSLNAIYDALFARGHERVAEYVGAAVGDLEPGLERLLAAARAVARWSVTESGLSPLMYWRPVPGFEPSPESYAPSQAQWQAMRADLTAAVRRGQLRPAADSDAAMRMLTVLVGGICSQYLANEPGVPPEDSDFLALLDEALEMYVRHYGPVRRKAKR